MLSTILFELTLQEVIAGIPHDLGALVAYVLLGSFAGLIWLGSRSKKQSPSGGDGAATAAPPLLETRRSGRGRAAH